MGLYFQAKRVATPLQVYFFSPPHMLINMITSGELRFVKWSQGIYLKGLVAAMLTQILYRSNSTWLASYTLGPNLGKK